LEATGKEKANRRLNVDEKRDVAQIRGLTILAYHEFDGMTFKQIGELFGISAVRANQIAKQSIRDLARQSPFSFVENNKRKFKANLSKNKRDSGKLFLGFRSNPKQFQGR